MAGEDRFRSFVERYVIGRAQHFRVGHEKEDGWAAILDGQTLYDRIEYASIDYYHRKGAEARAAGRAQAGPAVVQQMATPNAVLATYAVQRLFNPKGGT